MGYVLRRRDDADELGHLRKLAQAYDSRTFEVLDQIGIRVGWRCLEVGAGIGSVARWLAYRVGDTGYVLATDAEPRLPPDMTLPHLKSIEHNVVVNDLPGEFDLVHIRFLLDTLPERQAVLTKLIAAARDGGWVVIEEFDLGSLGPVAGSAKATKRFATVAAAYRRWLTAAGSDVRFGGKGRALLERDLPANEVRAGIYGSVRRSGTIEARTWRGSVEQAKAGMVKANLVSSAMVEEHLADLDQDRELYFLPPLMVSTFLRKRLKSDDD